ncbi:MAG: glycosyl transferase family 1, partial [Halobacteriales archaeon]
MARVAIAHNTLDFQGGADAVCLHACAALQDRHDVTLFTASETAPSDLAPRFGVAADVDVRSPPGATAVARGLAAAAPWVGPQLAVRSLLVGRYVRRVAGRFDVAVSTANEFALPLPSVQYVHYPQFNGHRLEEASGGRLNRLWTRLAGLAPPERFPTTRTAGDTTLLANSTWTADAVERLYDRRPTVVHPPVDPIADPADWPDREDGVVVVGRLAPDKRLLDAVRIVEGVRRRGHDLHLHVVGAAPRAYRRYADRIETAAAPSHVTLERDVDRSRLLARLRT